MGTRENFIHNGTFHEAMTAVLVVAQCFGVMPVIGITSKDPRKLRFSFKSFRMVNFYITFCCVSILFGIIISWTIRKKMEFGKIEKIIFYGYNLVGLGCFMSLARKWPKLMQKWTKVDMELPPLKTIYEKSALAYKIRMISLIIMTMSLSKFFYLEITTRVILMRQFSSSPKP